ncbi:MAG: hypothetical protein FWH08_04915 [Oscillospiraceae bacterium]|nr:hypothetical protein [Oscillospiraceae bacterium]
MLKLKKGKDKNPKKSETSENSENQENKENTEKREVSENSEDYEHEGNQESLEIQEPKELKVINSLVGNLSHALEEDAGEIDEMFDREQPREYQHREKKPARYRFFLIFGLLVFWLAIIGALSVVGTVREFVYDVTHQTALREEFERFIYPVVLNDPPEFTDTDNLQPATVIASAIWQIIISGDTSNYERSMGMMSIPETDVETVARSIFGSGFEISHRTIDNIIIEFEYVVESKSYTVPENPAYFTFLPRVTEISNNGETYRLIVEYTAPTPMSIAGIEYESEPVKTMIYTITRGRDKAKVIQSIELDREQSEIQEFSDFPDFWEFSAESE